MFDVGMGEIGLIAVIALLVLGPERLPRAARTAGALLRKARQSWQSVQAEIERELAAEELKRSLQRTAAEADPRTDLAAAARDAAAPPAPAERAAPRHE
jgi:sec-independent protein translocase protein TatB